ncbi:MAG: TIGR03663 family protein [Kiritimatiellaeota bacterium]|nr:TIGR03663 family protein [Kiritimatiellota bacterium]
MNSEHHHQVAVTLRLITWFAGACLLALLLRVPQLSARPMHTDEAVNGYLVGQQLDGARYHYDPEDRHGPALLAVALPLAKLLGADSFENLTEYTCRMTTVLMGALAVLLFLPLARAFGWMAVAAAVLWAVAPLPLYYSRYFIHETGFAAMTLAVMGGGVRAVLASSPGRRAGWSAFAGVGLGLMFAFKETAILHLAVLGLAMLVVARPVWRLHWRLLLAYGLFGAAVAAFVTLAFYSWGFTNWEGPVDFVKSFAHYSSRAGGEGHEKPWWYYFALLGGGRSGLVWLGLSVWGGWNLWRHGGWRAHVLIVYTVAVFVIYSVVPYKQPWLALNLWLPQALLVGWFAADLHAHRRYAWLAVFAVALLTLLGADVRTRVFRDAHGDRNPYAYAHTGSDVEHLVARIEQLSQPPHNHNPVIAVVMKDPWPLPWYLRQYRVGFWKEDQDPGPADFYITFAEFPEKLRPRVQGISPEIFGIRPNELLLMWPKQTL